MTHTTGGCRDLRQYMNDPKIIEAFGKLISGKSGYIPIIERREEPVICSNCNQHLLGDEKFCPECGTKIKLEKTENKEK